MNLLSRLSSGQDRASKDPREFTEPVEDQICYTLVVAQRRGRRRGSKPLTGFGYAGVVEIVSERGRGTFRAVYTLRYRELVSLLHASQRKSKTGRETLRRDMELITRRLREAERIAEG